MSGARVAAPRPPDAVPRGESRVLVLTSSLGSGHLRAAQAIEAALGRIAPAAIVERLDFWSLMNPGVAATIRDKYLELVLGHPDLYSQLHSLDERTWRRVIDNDIPPPAEVVELIELVAPSADNGWGSAAHLFEWALGPYASDLLLYPTACAALPARTREHAGVNVAWLREALFKWAFLRLQGRMEQHLLAFEPDVVVATQMVPAALVSALKMQSRRWSTLPLVGVLTDFGAHDFWMQPGIDLYCVPHPSLVRAPFGSNATRTTARVAVTGVPLMPGFANPPARSAARQSLGLDAPDASPVVLVLGGGLGVGLDVLVEPLLRQLRAGTVVVMAGRNEAARVNLCTMARESGLRLRVCGWTDSMQEYIAAADIVVGKSGGLTVAEVLACGRPLLVTKSLRGQETFNVQFLEREGVGCFVSPEGLAEQVSSWLSDPAHMQELQARAWRAGKRHGAALVAAHALRLARRTGPRVTTSRAGA